ncbi:ABC transporter permease [Corynebacterium macginleyi]|uniref:ABC transporter permease n=1 Tax=Corynebacterium macginleyi TaxID=38290 RepID=A0ABS1Y608_9CORY|nr:ABC transporter permease [Corynebacterium macginleyi]MBK4137347.1 ABC transporter permease [Corynebacterium macginleyi]MBK4141587.1 ABC transporter permease [Corynebacterium macginleyi]MBK4148576.1 ABC transporter permease [Corynebacterium macginleyi]MBK4151818.1 ABC transporter permease [Corynebacterium macginleyi]MBK4159762.1 ABC transporter permease [Corynebacterium macginleyi]
MSATSSPGTFRPAPQRASAGAIILAQGGMEAKLMLRHGEQQLLSIIIPLAILIGTSRLEATTGHGLHEVFPMVLAVATTSAGFTGQAISLAFDRRYGALKRTGASGVPAWAIIGGKIIGVLTMVAFQLLVLGATAFALGLRMGWSGILLTIVSLIFGVATFTAMGLVLGGTLSSEAVLALANLIWFILLAIVGWALYSQGLGDNGLLNIVPTVALASALADASNSTFPGIELISLTAWLAVASYAAVRWFRFEG